MRDEKKEIMLPQTGKFAICAWVFRSPSLFFLHGQMKKKACFQSIFVKFFKRIHGGYKLCGLAVAFSVILVDTQMV